MTTLELTVGIDERDDEAALRALAGSALGVTADRIAAVRVRRRSLDARGAAKLRLRCDVYLDEVAPPEGPPVLSLPSASTSRPVVVIVGCGPAGMFAAIRLLQLGVKPIVIERGKDVQARRRDLARITRQGIVDPDSNYSFGEGGAGTYSDGKLYTRVKDKALIRQVLEALVAHGADPDILVEAHPHIGSNKLPKIVASMRDAILAAGGEIRFETRVSDFLFDAAGAMRGVVTTNGEEIGGEAVVLAAGHSSRELFEVLHRCGVRLEAKPFAMGVRVEHPQPLIDSIQYRGTRSWRKDDLAEWRHPKLPAASYRLAETIDSRGVFSFCMCPGGWIVPAATAPDELVVNGMSLSRRDSPFANSGLVVAIEIEDCAPYAAPENPNDALAGLRYQRHLERSAFAAGGGAQKAPAQRLVDFCNDIDSASLPACSYQPGLTATRLRDVLPAAIGERLAAAFKKFDSNMRGYYTNEAVLVCVESRTSSPVRVPRDDATLHHPETAGLYPCGEGAGYAGGIVSAAIDGLRVAEACAAAIVP